MGFALVDYDQLKENLFQSIETLIKSYQREPCKIDRTRLPLLVANLKDKRRTQCEFLLQVINYTEGMDCSTPDEVEKQRRILNAAAYYILTKVAKSYSKGHLSILSSPKHSTLWNALRKALAITEDNEPTEDLVEFFTMYKNLKQFLCNHTYIDGNRLQPLLKIQVFSGHALYPHGVHQNNIVEDINDLTIKINALELLISKKDLKIKSSSNGVRLDNEILSYRLKI